MLVQVLRSNVTRLASSTCLVNTCLKLPRQNQAIDVRAGPVGTRYFRHCNGSRFLKGPELPAPGNIRAEASPLEGVARRGSGSPLSTHCTRTGSCPPPTAPAVASRSLRNGHFESAGSLPLHRPRRRGPNRPPAESMLLKSNAIRHGYCLDHHRDIPNSESPTRVECDSQKIQYRRTQMSRRFVSGILDRQVNSAANRAAIRAVIGRTGHRTEIRMEGVSIRESYPFIVIEFSRLQLNSGNRFPFSLGIHVCPPPVT